MGHEEGLGGQNGKDDNDTIKCDIWIGPGVKSMSDIWRINVGLNFEKKKQVCKFFHTMDTKNPALNVIIIWCMIVRQVYKGTLETVYLDNPIAETTWILILQT